MTNARPPDEKHVTIVSQPSERLYIARLEVYFQLADFLDNTEGVCRLLHDGTFVKIEPLRTAPWEVGKKFLFTLEGFSTQEVAKASGHRLAQSLLWTAVSMNFYIRLQQAPYVLPNRIRPKGNLGFMPMVQHYQLNEVLDELHNSYAELDEPDEALLLSMQIFAGAELEASPYARF